MSGDAAKLQSRIEEFFKLKGDGLEEYKASPKPFEEALECFMNDLGFGTAGLRSEMDVGFNRMNEVTVRIASMGIARYLREVCQGATMVIIGHDHRHNSKQFAIISAQVYSFYGHEVKMFPENVPTPFVSSGVGCFKGIAGLGVMITASHNPKRDNGYKVFGGNGAQIVDSVAKEICKYIESERGKYEEVKRSERLYTIQQGDYLMKRVTDWYVGNLKGFLVDRYWNRSGSVVPFRVVYTALHGVGGKYVDQVFESVFDLPSDEYIIHVKEQRDPDPEFRTVEFPNPEEGLATLKLAMEEADRQGIPYVFANDPDADRFCVCEKDLKRGEWRIFNGNEIAVLLADFIGSRVEGSDEGKYAMLGSCVSSKFLSGYCIRRGWRFEETLTGFKNLGNVGLHLKTAENYKILFAYEEAIGFQIGDWNFDKDGISSLMTFYALIAGINNPIISHLKGIYEREAVWPLQFNGYFTIKPASRIKTIINSITPPPNEHAIFSNTGNVVKLDFSDEKIWLMLRSSGTEPKLKFYSEWLGEAESSAVEVENFKNRINQLIESMISSKI